MAGMSAQYDEQMNFLKSTFAKLETNSMTTKNFFELPGVLARYNSPDYEKNTAEHSEEMFQEIVSYYVNLNRRRRKITQKQIAEALHISQPGVCQMLKRPATISKLWRLSVAMGGKLEVNIRFGDKVYSLLNEPLPGSEEE
jgi:predicted XRE-type DNA-binding protein